jgi:hypothetical protein
MNILRCKKGGGQFPHDYGTRHIIDQNPQISSGLVRMLKIHMQMSLCSCKGT